ncbi:UNVERIFIED_CONTAM: hypothetical protein GTU68_010234 [Idotea baltica]|nr:hypothetical protein [Idotea baltica]
MARSTTPLDITDLSNPGLYVNRELALLEFNRRVLAQAQDEDLPLLERLRFLCIASSVLDEFFEIRVAGLKQQEAYGSAQRGPDNMSPTEQLVQISERARALADTRYEVFNNDLLPKLNLQGIRILDTQEWNDKQAQWLKRYFNRELAPILSPVGLDPAHPFPEPLNKNQHKTPHLHHFTPCRATMPLVVKAAKRCCRHPERPNDFVLLSSIIQAHVGDLFRGMQTTGCYAFRVTRNSDLFVDEEEVDDLLRALEGELSSRHYGDAVRLEVSADCPAELSAFLASQFRVSREDVYYCGGPVNMMRLAAIPDLVERSDLKFPGFNPGLPTTLQPGVDLFASIRTGDILLHHPFESFVPVVEFLRQAAVDDKVLSIRQTLYRTGADSAVVQALVDAANNGKEVMVVIELRARFDEEANIELATLLQNAGAQVVYGVVHHKTHAKMSMVIRREGRGLRRYVHLGTGNYHARTARAYTDYGMFTCDPEIGEDVQEIFSQLTTMGRAGRLKKLLQSPFTLHRSMLEYIDFEINEAEHGRPAWIRAKMNSLIEPQIIQRLYRASQAGVKVDLVVRGVCSLRPGVKGVSHNIRVRSIVGRFLEHTRLFAFANAGAPRVFLSSADWMDRNFFKRVETCFPLEDDEIRSRVMQEFDYYMLDNTQAWLMQSDGTYRKVTQGKQRRRTAQLQLLQELSEEGGV